MSYTKTTWVNNSTPAINATNLNKIENGIYNNDAAIATLNTNFEEIKGTILWQNLNPESNFNAQTIELNSSNYDMIEIIGGSWNHSGHRKCVSTKGFIGKDLMLTTQFVTGGNTFYIASREFNYIDATHYAVQSSRAVDSNNITQLLTNNEVLIPYLIIGYKTGLFDN